MIELTAALVLLHVLLHVAALCALWRALRLSQLIWAALVPVLVPLGLWEARGKLGRTGRLLLWAWALSLVAVVAALALLSPA